MTLRRLMTSLVAVGMFGAHTLDAAHARRQYHDDRSAYELLLHLTMTTMATGLLFSAAVPFIVQGPEPSTYSDLRGFGLTLTRWVMFVASIVLFMADRELSRHGGRRRR